MVVACVIPNAPVVVTDPVNGAVVVTLVTVPPPAGVVQAPAPFRYVAADPDKARFVYVPDPVRCIRPFAEKSPSARYAPAACFPLKVFQSVDDR